MTVCVLNMTGKVVNIPIFLKCAKKFLNMTVFVPMFTVLVGNMTALFLNKTVFALNISVFDLNMTVIFQNMIDFVLR